uniref:Uncharacterized protein n=1 Tax=Arundo donax TaxID=35708 RepID=A0A0A9A4P0_ARUDO
MITCLTPFIGACCMVVKLNMMHACRLDLFIYAIDNT